MSRDALVVGVNTYQNLPGLKAPARDAEAVAKMLHTYGEFRVHRLPEVLQAGQPQVGQKTQVTLQMLESALIQLFKPKGRSVAQTALFYFSGHGLQREAGIREGFLAPSNTDPDRGFYGLSLFWLRRLLQESPVRQRIIILDCCHSGELLNFLEADPGAVPGTDRLFMAASREYETAYESIDSPYSVFTQALLTGLDPSRNQTGTVNHHALTDWVNHQLKGEIQQPLFESSGSEIILTRQVTRLDRPLDRMEGTTNLYPTQPPIQTSSLSLVCPYRGQECFEEQHAEFFFGREALTVELLQKLETDRLVAVVGASGIGKSSLVRAGLVPLLRQKHQRQRHQQPIEQVCTASTPTAPGQGSLSASFQPPTSDLQIKLLTPSVHPLKSLAAAFVSPEANPIDRAEQLVRAEQLLQSGAAGLVQLIRASLPPSGTTGLSPSRPTCGGSVKRSQVVLIIDQLEEIFAQSVTEWERQQFFACLAVAEQELANCLKIVVVLRSDFINQCQSFELLAAPVTRHPVVVPSLKYEQLKAAIVRPAQKAGLRCEPNLVYTLLLDVMGASGELALLQSTLLKLWQQRQSTPEGIDCLTLESYHALGGIRQLLPAQATDLMRHFNAVEQAIAQRIFLKLTQFGEGTEDTRRRVSKSQIISPAFAPEEAGLVERILEKLVSARLLVVDQVVINAPEQQITTSSSQASSQSERSADDRITDDRSTRNPLRRGQVKRDGMQLPAAHPTLPEKLSQPVVDVAHEALIRHWTLLRQWCDRDRDMLRCLRGLEEAAQIWYAAGQPASVEFLLTGTRLHEAERLLADHAQELTALTQEYVLASRQETKRLQRESRQLRLAVPACLVATLAVILGQSLSAIQSQTEKEEQLRLATARERAAITQTILQEANSPTTALLIGRLAAQEGASDVAENSLRQSLQTLRLQLELPATQSGIEQITLSPDQRHLATASADGKIHLWSIHPYRLYSRTSPPQPGQILDWTIGAGEPLAEKLPITGVQFSPDGQSIAAFVAGQPDIKLWSVQYGALLLHLKGSAPVKQIRFSPTGEWIAAVHADRSLAMWRTDTGQLQTRLVHTEAIDQVQFTPDGQFLLLGSEALPRPQSLRRYRLVGAANHTLQLQPAAMPDLATPNQKNLMQAKQIQHTVLSPQGQWLATWRAGQVSLKQSITGQPAGHFSVSGTVKMRFSPDDRQLAVLAGDRLLLYNVATQRLKQIALGDWGASPTAASSLPANPASHRETELTFSPDGQWLAVRSWETAGNRKHQIIQIWNGRSGERVGMPLQADKVTTLYFSPDNAYLITGDGEGRLQFWAVQTGGELPTLEQVNAPTQWTVFLTPDRLSDAQINSEQGQAGQKEGQNSGKQATQLITIAADGQLQQWSLPSLAGAPVASPSPTFPLPVHTAALEQQSFWQKFTQQKFTQQKFTQSPVQRNFLAMTPIASPFNAWAKPRRGQSEPAEVDALQLQPSVGVESATAGKFQTRSLPDQEVMRPAARSSALPFPGLLSSAALSRDGQWFALADAQGTIALRQRQANQNFALRYQIQNWALESRSERGDIASGSLSQVTETPINPSNSATSDRPAPETAQRRVRIEQLSFSPDGRYLLGVGSDKTVRLWQVESGTLIQIWADHQAKIHQARFSPDGSFIMTASEDKTARIFRIEAGQASQNLDSAASQVPAKVSLSRSLAVLQHSTAVSSSSFSPDQQQVVTGGIDGQARIYDRATGQLQFVLMGHGAAITDVQYSPDGKFIVTASADGTAIVWSARTGERQAVLNSDRQRATVQPLLQASFSPAGDYIATLAQNGQVHLWAATWQHLLTLAQERTTRQLTPEECSRYLNLSAENCPKLSVPE
ncbi:nSTAND1 domain-containing NTPase [Leptolyngbya ohadii]|uniref:nSTAND1 domain-containing NTPase n=1 Tax=Leptolyngbya ohadii TaxID=1962290 RepID=UPI000B599727|nr:caspase family protein [Leptolyngbya ohadii]